MARKKKQSKKTDRKSTRLNSSHGYISYAVFCLKKKTKNDVIVNRKCKYIENKITNIDNEYDES